MACSKMLAPHINDSDESVVAANYQKLYNKVYNDINKKGVVDLKNYFSKEKLAAMPKLEKTVYINKAKNYLIMKELGELL